MPHLRQFQLPALFASALAVVAAVACQGSDSTKTATETTATSGTTGTGIDTTSAALQVGNIERGREVFRNETFGDEGFWTDAARMPQGMKTAKMTVLDALKAGVNFDVDAMPADLKAALAREVTTDHSPAKAPKLNDPATLDALVKANAVIGMVPKGGKVGVTCALCHAITDKSLYELTGKGTIGKRIDGPTQHSLNVGKLLATCDNTRAFFTTAQLVGPDGSTIGRASKGLTAKSTEAEFDAYFSNPKYYPVGMFDDSPDGNGNPVHITPFFRQDLAAPYGSSGQNSDLNDFNNTVYTALFDQSNLLSDGGRQFIHGLGATAGDSMLAGYTKVLAATDVTGYPYVTAALKGKAGEPPTPTGKRVDEQKLRDLQAYVNSLPAPKGVVTNAAQVTSGRALFVTQNCASCHNTNQGVAVQSKLVPMNVIWPGYAPKVLTQRKPPLTPIQNSPGTFDDKMIVVDASPGGGPRGNALPLLLDLARKPVFLHDDSVHSLDELLNPKRGKTAPHPFYVVSPAQRTEMVAYLKSLDTDSK
jgi:mono/diheme cytochrome c family protein